MTDQVGSRNNYPARSTASGDFLLSQYREGSTAEGRGSTAGAEVILRPAPACPPAPAPALWSMEPQVGF